MIRVITYIFVNEYNNNAFYLWDDTSTLFVVFLPLLHTNIWDVLHMSTECPPEVKLYLFHSLFWYSIYRTAQLVRCTVVIFHFISLASSEV